MGFGDVKLAAVMGLYLGWLAPDYLTAFRLVLWACSSASSSARSSASSCSGHPRPQHAAIPFGPFLAFGTLLVVLLSPQLVTARRLSA